MLTDTARYIVTYSCLKKLLIYVHIVGAKVNNIFSFDHKTEICVTKQENA